jgi:ABC-type multidrug transport system fused ATPase/permease subunit
MWSNHSIRLRGKKYFLYGILFPSSPHCCFFCRIFNVIDQADTNFRASSCTTAAAAAPLSVSSSSSTAGKPPALAKSHYGAPAALTNDEECYTPTSKRYDDATILIENLSFSYKTRSNVTVLKNISLAIQKNQITCIVGKSGSGKSTLTALLCGLYYPDEGKIVYGKSKNHLQVAAGEKMTYEKEKLLHDLFGVVEQSSTTLFSGTILDNIAYGRVKASPFLLFSYSSNRFLSSLLSICSRVQLKSKSKLLLVLLMLMNLFLLSLRDIRPQWVRKVVYFPGGNELVLLSREH